MDVQVVDVYFPKHPVTSQRQAFCFVTFSTRKAANAAVSQSNRKINGHQVSSIASTADRPMHHRSGQQPVPLQHQTSLLAEVPARYCQAHIMSPDKMPPTCLHLPTVAHNLWAGQATLAPTLPTAQDMSGALDMHSLLVSPLDSLNSQAALALLLAANRPSSGAVRSAGMPTWHSNVPTHFSPVAPAYLQAHMLATSGPDTSGPPYLHNEEAVLDHRHWAAWNSRCMGTSLNVGQLCVPDAATLPPALPGWPGAADSMHQPALPSVLFGNSINSRVPDVPDVQMARAQSEPCEMSFGHRPHRHSNMQDVQHVRHSPY
ncbi:MAG: RNA-binding squid [Trebouxia sp. A1-2]|nr:MAG: RNA-binding squid [Trebouxia sp. A1-2]